MTELPELAHCPTCTGYFDADDMTGGGCPNCAGPEPVDPWAGREDREASVVENATGLIAQRDQARRFAAAWQGAAEAYREVVEALTHEYEPPDRPDHVLCRYVFCRLAAEHPTHRTVAVIEAELQPEEIRDAPDFDSGQVPASTGEQQR